jgi:chemotaxis family two-component system response regulator Rcp1
LSFALLEERLPLVDILLVENNEGDIRLAEEALRETDFDATLHVVRDGIEALDFLGREGPYADAPRPSLILLDLNMPRLGGREVLERIKEDDELKSIPVVVLSTSSAQEDVELSYQLHANCYFTKPPELNAYLDMVQNIERFWLQLVDLPPAS